MKLLGDAAVAMWWNVATENLTEFHEWHSKEHFPERLSIPGFNRGSRWQREGDGAFFVIYELDAYETLTSPAYHARLDDPTPWSTKMMPLHRDMIRSQCRVAASRGGGIATFMSTLRLSPEPDGEARLDAFLRGLVTELPAIEGVTGAHLLHTETPVAAQTREQRIRGGDATADWILLVSGHDAAALADLRIGRLAVSRLRDAAARAPEESETYRLVYAMTPADV